MLVDLSGMVVHRGFLFALISSCSSPLPLATCPVDFSYNYGKQPHGPEKESQDYLYPKSLSFLTNPLPCHHPMSPPIFLSKKTLWTKLYLIVRVQVIDVAGILHRVWKVIQLVGLLVVLVKRQKLWWGKSSSEDPKRRYLRPICLFYPMSPPSPSILALGLGPHLGHVSFIDLQGGSHGDSRIRCCFSIMGHQVSRKLKGRNQKDERGPAGKAVTPTSPHATMRKSTSQTEPSAVTCPRTTAVATPGSKQGLWMSRESWETPYCFFMVSCRIRHGVQWLWVWGGEGGQ